MPHDTPGNYLHDEISLLYKEINTSGDLDGIQVPKLIQSLIEQTVTSISSSIQNNTSQEIVYEIKNIKVAYMGIHDNKEGKITKYEALIRFDNNGTILLPGHFHHLLTLEQEEEATLKLIEEVVKKLSQEEDISISINLSHNNLLNNTILNEIDSYLKKYNVDPSTLTIELLEDIECDGKFLPNTIEKLNEIGVKIAIDDLLTQFNDYYRFIKHKECHYAKIDGSFIRALTNPELRTREMAYKLIKHIVNIAHSRDQEVMAEYIENNLLQEIIKELGIAYSQGYHFSKPKID